MYPDLPGSYRQMLLRLHCHFLFVSLFLSYSLYSKTVKDTGKGLTAAVYILILSELGISIASTIYASQAFCECCRLCVECEQRYCRGCNDCECDCNGTSGYDQYSVSIIIIHL